MRGVSDTYPINSGGFQQPVQRGFNRLTAIDVIRRRERRIFPSDAHRTGDAGPIGAVDPAGVEPDWDAVYADQLPRIYNFFRYRFGVDR